VKERALRILVGVLAGLLLLAVSIWVLGKALGNRHFPAFYAGRTMDDWEQQLYGNNAAASNAAFAIIQSQVIPQFVEAMLHDTNDSPARLALIETVGSLPGIEIDYLKARYRRAEAASYLGELGPAAKSALPDLIRALKGDDPAFRQIVITSLGKIHSDPDTVIPVLIPYLEDENLDAAAANALAEFGSLAKAAVPKLLPLLHAQDDDDQVAAQNALLKIDPEAAAKAGIKAN
jgi:hypothetical protein